MTKQILILVLLTACSGKHRDEAIMKEAARIHNETMILAVTVEERINTYEKDSMQTAPRDSINSWRQMFELWEEDVVEVPGNEAEHTHTGHHQHDHRPLDITAEQMLEIQQSLASRMAELEQRIHALQ